MHLLVLAPQPFFVQRGTPIAVRMALETLSANGHTADVLTFPGGQDVDIPGVRLIRTPALPGLKNIGPGFSVKKLVCDAMMAPMAAWRMARTRYDLALAVEESAFIALTLKPFSGLPYIFDVDSSIPEQMSDKYTKMPKWLLGLLTRLEASAARGAVGAITCCSALQDTIKGHAPDTPVRTLEDITMLEPDDGAPPPDDVRFDEPIVMYVGNLESYQGVGLLLDGFAKLTPDDGPARLVVIGGSEAHIAEYEARAEALGVSERVSFLGPRPIEMLGRYLRAAAIVASPRTQGRNTPMKVYSYLDSGRPMIATRLPTHTQVLTDDISMLVTPDADDMARGLRELLADPDRRARMAAAAAERVQAEYCREAYDRKLLSFMDEVIAPLVAHRRQPAS